MPTSCLLLRIDGENFDYEDNQMRVDIRLMIMQTNELS